MNTISFDTFERSIAMLIATIVLYVAFIISLTLIGWRAEYKMVIYVELYRSLEIESRTSEEGLELLAKVNRYKRTYDICQSILTRLGLPLY